MKRKLLLINPASDAGGNISSYMRFPTLSFAYIAALTPSNWEIKLIDENISKYKSEEADLVGLTSVTYSAPRAYELASHFRKRGITTIMGGIHASILPEEALNFVDAVAIGEIESLWGIIIKDFA